MATLCTRQRRRSVRAVCSILKRSFVVRLCLTAGLTFLVLSEFASLLPTALLVEIPVMKGSLLATEKAPNSEKQQNPSSSSDRDWLTKITSAQRGTDKSSSGETPSSPPSTQSADSPKPQPVAPMPAAIATPMSNGFKSSISVNLTQPFFSCDWQVEAIPRPTRYQAFLECTTTSAGIIYKEVLSNSTPVTTLSGSDTPCLKRVIQTSCTDVNLRVPRLAHYVWFGQKKMTLYFFVSCLSVVRFLRPCLVLFHGDALPVGPFWSALLQLVPNVMYLPHSRPREIFSRVINVVEHSADVKRLQVLIDYGGVYVDVDQFLLRPVDDLRASHTVIGIETNGKKCGNGLIFSEPGAEFLRLWLANYTTFDDSQWGDHSTVLPFNLSRSYPHLVTVVDSFFRPNYNKIKPLYIDRNFDWSDLYGLHLYFRFYYGYYATRLDKMKCTVGDMTRYILFGGKDVCLKT